MSNANDNTVLAFDAATCNALANSGCGVGTARSLVTGMQPQHVTYDPATSTLYVPNGNSNVLSHCSTRRPATPSWAPGAACPCSALRALPGEPEWAGGIYERVEHLFNGGDPSGMVNAISCTSWGKAVATGYGKGYIFKPVAGYTQARCRSSCVPPSLVTAVPPARSHMSTSRLESPLGLEANWALVGLERRQNSLSSRFLTFPHQNVSPLLLRAPIVRISESRSQSSSSVTPAK